MTQFEPSLFRAPDHPLESKADRLQAQIRGSAAQNYRARRLPRLEVGRFVIRFAENAADIERVLRLRFEVFNLELNEGLESSFATGFDFDAFDVVCDHLMVEDSRNGQLVGTYRMQMAGAKADGLGLYCAQEFDFSTLPEQVVDQAVELGRACIAREHRNGIVLFALWKGLAAYITWTRRRYLFGCCSLTSQDLTEARAFERFLVRSGKMHPSLHVRPWPSHACGEAGDPQPEEEDPKVPKLFASYLRFGVKVCSAAAIDREFKTIDFLVISDIDTLDLRTRRLFFSGLPDFEIQAAPKSGRGDRA